MLPWSAGGWGSRAECLALRCCWSGCGFFCSYQDHAAVAGCTARVSAHPIPLVWQAGKCFGWRLLWPLVLSWRSALIFASLQIPCPFGHTSFLLTWHHCRPMLLGASLRLVPRRKHFHQPWWPLPHPSYWTLLGGLLPYPQVSRGKINVLLYFWCWTGGIRLPIMMITSVFVSIDSVPIIISPLFPLKEVACPGWSKGTSDALGISSQNGEGTQPPHLDFMTFQGFKVRG